MAHVRKVALVDPRLLDKLHTSTKPPVDMTLRDLDAEMTNILDKTDIDVSEKVRLYNQALLRYNDMTKLAAAKPTPVVVVKEQNPDAPDVMAEVATMLPKGLQEKGRQLVSRLKTIKWNDRGELLHEGVVVPGSNMVDLVHDLLRNRKTSEPAGWQQFASQMHAANIPMELVGNVTRRQCLSQDFDFFQKRSYLIFLGSYLQKRGVIHSQRKLRDKARKLCEQVRSIYITCPE